MLSATAPQHGASPAGWLTLLALGAALAGVYALLCWLRPFRNGRLRLGRRAHNWITDTTTNARH